MDDVAGSKAAASDDAGGAGAGAGSEAASAMESGGGGAADRWSASVSNVCEIQSAFDMLQRLLLKQTVYKDEEAFAHASSSANQARHIMVSYTSSLLPLSIHTPCHRYSILFPLVSVQFSFWVIHSIVAAKRGYIMPKDFETIRFCCIDFIYVPSLP